MNRYSRIAHAITHHAGSPQAFGVVVGLTLGWIMVGLASGASRAWELTITCGVPILTLLMVIVLQHAQNRDSKSIDIKLNELLLTLEEPDSEVIHSRHLADNDLEALDQRHVEQAESEAQGAATSPRAPA
ncbi:MAG: low affinity iron permease family protein [Acidimicrobiia bacterium]|nr:low affinity iron permease family protein [Acidimicrobiia bacterium]